MTDQQLTHIDEQGAVRTVDVSQKADTGAGRRIEGFIAASRGARAYRGGQGGEATCWRARVAGGNGCQADELPHPHVPSAPASRRRWSARPWPKASAPTASWASM